MYNYAPYLHNEIMSVQGYPSGGPIQYVIQVNADCELSKDGLC